MVEFGLKLEDNRVSEWSEYYVRYEKLKSILKKASASLARYNEMAKKRPELAAAVKDSFRQGLPTPQSSRENLQKAEEKQVPPRQTPGKGCRSSLESIDEHHDGTEKSKKSHESVDEHHDEKETNEKSQLLQLKESKPEGEGLSYGSSGGDSSVAAKSISSSLPRVPPERRDSKGNLISRAFEAASSGVNDYLTQSYERQTRETLKDLDKHSKAFGDNLVTDIDTVNAFYNQKLQELEERLRFLKESVDHLRKSGHLMPPTPPPELGQTSEVEETRSSVRSIHEDDDLETPLLHSSKQIMPMQLAKSIVRMSLRNSGRVTQPLWTEDHDEGETTINKEERQNKVKEVESIQRALIDQYRTAKLLLNFAIMNFTGFVKIVKKHDKTLPEEKGRYKQAIKPERICNEGKEVEVLTARMENLYAIWFCDRSISEARAQMFTKKGDGLEMDWSQLRLGYRMGMCCVLSLWVGWDCFWGLVSKGDTTIGGRTAFPVFRGIAGLLLLQWFWGCSVWVWNRYRVNYIYLFDFNPHAVSSPLAILNEAVDNSLFFLVCLLLYYKAGSHDMPGNFPAGFVPFVLVIYTVYQLVVPLRTRGPMWKAIWLLITAPATSPSFFHGYVGDIFTSMVKVFQDLVWTICFVVSGDWLIHEDLDSPTRHGWSTAFWYKRILIPLICLLPLWFRFNQCCRKYLDTGDRFPHLANGFKYALSQTVTLFGAFHPLYTVVEKNRGDFGGFSLFDAFWMLAFVSSSLYSFVWDVYMDWGLGRPKYNYLGPSLMYPQRFMYYTIIAIDLVLRFAWVLTLLPPQSGATFALPQYLSAVSMTFELFRRTIWGFLRLENEHRSNASGYRRVAFVPLHFSTGHTRDFGQNERQHRGFSVLLEVALITLLVVAACGIAVVAAQRATEQERSLFEL